MEKPLLIHNKKECISCGACAAISPEFWYMDEEGLAHVKGSVAVNTHWEKKIDSEAEKVQHEEAASVCPVNIIKIEKKEYNEQKE